MAKKSESFFSRILSSILGGNDPEAEKKKQLKAIAKSLSKQHFKFYKAGSDQALPAFGKFFFDIYKAVSASQVMFNNMPNPNYYKDLVVDVSLSENQKKLIEDLSEEAIQTKARTVEFNQLKQKVKADLESFESEFDQQKIQEIDAAYTMLMSFKSFCTFDYYFILRKFDSTLRENDTSRTPKFNAIDASYISDDLKDFLAIIWSMPLEKNWANMLSILKAARGVEPIKPQLWNKIVKLLVQIRNARVLEMIIQLTTKDPNYTVQSEVKNEQVVDAYITKVKREATTAIQKMENEQKSSKIDSLVTQIFATTSVRGVKYYTEEGSEHLTKRNFDGFVFARPLNYLKAFLIEYVKKDVREFADLVLVRGKWSTVQLSTEMSDAYNLLLEYSEKITAFDEKLSEEKGEFGTKIKTLLPRAERDKEAANIIRTTLRDCNNLAREFIINTTKNLISFAKSTKSLLEDYQKPHPEMLINWKELERFAEHPIKDLGVEVYKKIYLIVSLMQNFVGNKR